MLEKDPRRFNKIQALKDKQGKIATSTRADAEAENDSESPADDDFEEPPQDARDKSTKTVATNKPAPKKRATGSKKSATTTPAPPTIRGGKITKVAEGRKGIRPHRSVNFGYRSAPSDSEHEEIRRTATTLSGRTLKLVKLKETIDRHAAWCPFVHLNKKLHHAHRRIRALQNRPNDEPELPETLDKFDDDNDDDSIEKDDPTGEDEDQDEGYSEGQITNAPRMRKTQVLALEKKAAGAKQLARLNDDGANQSTRADSLPGNEDNDTSIVHATAGTADKNARLTKVARSEDEALSKTSHAQSSVSGSEDDNDDEENGHAAPSTTPEDGKLKQLIRLEHAAPQPSVGLDDTTKAGAAKKRKVSETGLTSEAEPASKNRKIHAD